LFTVLASQGASIGMELVILIEYVARGRRVLSTFTNLRNLRKRIKYICGNRSVPSFLWSQERDIRWMRTVPHVWDQAFLVT
jgi:hypothetical protein